MMVFTMIVGLGSIVDRISLSQASGAAGGVEGVGPASRFGSGRVLTCISESCGGKNGDERRQKDRWYWPDVETHF